MRNRTDASRSQAAKHHNVSERKVRQADFVKKKSPELFQKVSNGEVRLAEAVRSVQKEEKREQLRTAAEAVKEHADEPSWRIIHGDCLSWLDAAKVGTPRLIFADPPYNVGIDYGDGTKADRRPDHEFLNWCQEWVAACHRALADDGSLWLLINDEYADHFGIILRRVGFHRRAWIKWYETFGVNCANNFNRTSRHLFYCVKDPKRFVFHPDALSRPSARQVLYNDGRAAEGGKLWDDVWAIPRLTGTGAERIPDFPTQLPLALLRPVIGCASDPGDLILDPFNGSGTTGAAALELGRRYVGIERQAKFHELATLRLKGACHGDPD